MHTCTRRAGDWKNWLFEVGHHVGCFSKEKEINVTHPWLHCLLINVRRRFKHRHAHTHSLFYYVAGPAVRLVNVLV